MKPRTHLNIFSPNMANKHFCPIVENCPKMLKKLNLLHSLHTPHFSYSFLLRISKSRTFLPSNASFPSGAKKFGSACDVHIFAIHVWPKNVQNDFSGKQSIRYFGAKKKGLENKRNWRICPSGKIILIEK